VIVFLESLLKIANWCCWWLI